jgi:hypothetical protein
LECAHATVRIPDLFSPQDLLAEVVATAEAEHLTDLMAATRALRVDLDKRTAEPNV